MMAYSVNCSGPGTVLSARVVIPLLRQTGPPTEGSSAPRTGPWRPAHVFCWTRWQIDSCGNDIQTY